MKNYFNHCTKKLYCCKRVFIPLLIILFSSQFINAQTNYYYDGSGALSTTTNWGTNTDGSGTNPSNFTANNQIFNIRNTSAVSLTTTWTINGTNSQLVVNNGVTFTTSTSSNLTVSAGCKFIINNGATVQSDVAITLGSTTTFQIDNGGTYIHNNTGTLSSTIFRGVESFGATSNFKINNWQATNIDILSNVTLSAQPGDGNSYAYGNLEINWTGNTATWGQGFNSNNTTYYICAGNFTVTSTGNSSGIFAFTSNKQPILKIYGNFNMTGGTVWWGTNNGGGVSVWPEIYLGGNLNMSAGTFTAAGNQIIGGFVFTGGASNSVNINCTGGTRQYVYYTINSPKYVTLSNDFDMGQNIVGDKLTIASGATLDAQAYTISNQTANPSSNCNVANNGTFRTSKTGGLYGNGSTYAVNTTSSSVTWVDGTGSTVEYYATGSQNITASTTYENLKILGGGTKTLQGTSTINKTLTLTSGKLDVQNYVLTMASTGSISGYSSSNYIITGSNTGRLTQNSLAASTARVFPVGTSSCYMPSTVTPAAASFNYSVNVFTGATKDGLYNGTAWSTTQKKGMVDAVWNVERSTISNVADVVSFQWDNCYSSLEGTDFAAAANTDIGIWYWASGTSWSLAATGFSSNNSNAGGLNTAANTSTFRYASTSGANTHYIVAISSNTLEVNTVKLIAEMKNNEVFLNWNTENPAAPIKYFEVERSYDKTHFVKLAALPFADKPLFTFADGIADAGQVYYRIKMVNANGKTSYSNIAAVNTGKIKTIKLLGNPVITEAILLHPAGVNAFFRIISAEGKTMASGKLNIASAISRINTVNLAKGIYTLQYINGNEIANIRMVK